MRSLKSWIEIRRYSYTWIKKDVDGIDKLANEEPAVMLIGIDVGDMVCDFATINIREE